MTRLIRRHSMERLELLDLDQYGGNYQLPPPLPPPRKSHLRRPSMNPTVERYQFLCNTTRSRTDPIYAATPMFTTIPQSSQKKFPRQLLGAYVRPENVKPVAAETPKSPEPNTDETDEGEGKEEEEEDENPEGEEDNADDDDDDDNQSSSSSSSDENEDAGGGGDDDDDNENKGVVEQIFTRDKKN